MTKDTALDLALEVMQINLKLLEKINPYKGQEDLLSDSLDLTHEAITAIKQARSAPVQEPDHGDELTIAYMSGLHDGKQKREWVGLTRDEVLSIGKELGLKCKLGGNANIDFDYAEAIEAKLKEKNNG